MTFFVLRPTIFILNTQHEPADTPVHLPVQVPAKHPGTLGRQSVSQYETVPAIKIFSMRNYLSSNTWTEQTGPLSLVEVLHYCALIGRELPK